MIAHSLVEVRLLGVPLQRLRMAQQHHDELFREFALMCTQSEDEHALPRRLIDLVDQLSRRFSSFTASAPQQMQAAEARGEETVDLVFRVPREAKGASRQLEAMLEEVDDFCREGDLLTLAPTLEAVAFRRWYLREFINQSEGKAPIPWSDELVFF